MGTFSIRQTGKAAGKPAAFSGKSREKMVLKPWAESGQTFPVLIRRKRGTVKAYRMFRAGCLR